MKINTTAALVATLCALASPAVAGNRVAQAIELADACLKPGVSGDAEVKLTGTCSAAQLKQVSDISMEIVVLLTIISSGDKMQTDAIRECTTSYSDVNEMTACLKVKTEAMTWITSTLPTFNMQQQLIFGGCALDNGSTDTATVDLVATVECYKAHAS